MSNERETERANAASVLKSRIDAEVGRILKAATPSQSVIYTGNRHDAIPTLLITDPVLEPVDKLVWMVTSTRIGKDGVCGVLPSYKQLARLAGIRSSSTIARALAILRAARWLSLCRQVRDERGRFRGNVYALHDEPAVLSEALCLDAEYFAFLEQACRHAHRRVQIVARSIQQSIDEDVASNRHGQELATPIERRMRAAQALTDSNGGRYFALTANARERINKESFDDDEAHRVRISKSVGSSSNNKSTTTTTPNGLSADCKKLEFPSRLNAAHRVLALKHLKRVAADQRQALLDELEGRLRAERYGAKPVWDAIQYLARLCECALGGTFHANLGVAVAAERERLKRQYAAACANASAEKPAKSRRAKENIEKLREIVARSLREEK